MDARYGLVDMVGIFKDAIYHCETKYLCQNSSSNLVLNFIFHLDTVVSNFICVRYFDTCYSGILAFW